MARVFQINFTVATGNKVNTNVLKASITGLLSMGKAALPVSFTFNPKYPKGNITWYLYEKANVKIYKGEMIVLVKEEKFSDGENINSKTLQKKVEDAIPCLADKKTKEPLGVDLIEIQCKKL